MCILNHIFSRDIEGYMGGIQAKTLISQMWEGRFRNEGNLWDRYQTANQKYRDILTGAYCKDLKRLKYVHASGRDAIETYKEAVDRFEDKKFLRDYRFVAHPLRETRNLQLIV